MDLVELFDVFKINIIQVKPWVKNNKKECN